MKSESTLRFCHIENGNYKYIVVPLCDCNAMVKAAAVLKDCNVINGYKAIKINDECFYIDLFQFSATRIHTDAEGNRLTYQTKKLIAWSELKLTPSEARQFIVRYNMTRLTTCLTPVRPLFPDQKTTKTAA